MGEIRTGTLVANAGNAFLYAIMSVAMAAITAATAEIAEIKVLILNRQSSVLCLEAGVSSNWFISSNPGM